MSAEFGECSFMTNVGFPAANTLPVRRSQLGIFEAHQGEISTDVADAPTELLEDANSCDQG
jgi:hypothetical protein